MTFLASHCFCVFVFYFAREHQNKAADDKFIAANFLNMALSHLNKIQRANLMNEILDNTTEHFDTNCKLWNYHRPKDLNVYGKIKIPLAGNVAVHRAVYYGINPLPPPDSGLELSHLCHNKRCVRLDHMVEETHQNNMLRKICKDAGCLGPTRHESPPCIVRNLHIPNIE